MQGAEKRNFEGEEVLPLRLSSVSYYLYINTLTLTGQETLRAASKQADARCREYENES